MPHRTAKNTCLQATDHHGVVIDESRIFMKSITRQEWYGALVAVIVLGVLLTFASPYFLTTGNLSNILVQASVIACSRADKPL